MAATATACIGGVVRAWLLLVRREPNRPGVSEGLGCFPEATLGPGPLREALRMTTPLPNRDGRPRSAE